ncbi:MAG: response regulator [Desulfobulbales bacterium]|nr:response regulator [Desulfobulbales bacterium]
MKKILVVDDEKNFLLSLADMLKANENDFSVETAGNGKEASDIIDSKKINLVVTDLNMPEMDGFELIAHISQVDPGIPVIAMTAYGTPEMESRLNNMGAFQYIEKPIDFDSLLGMINEGLKKGSTRGHVAGIALTSFMQLLELDNKTCTLHIKSAKGTGDMFFNQGELLTARTGELTGQNAAFEIINWDNPEIVIENTCKVKIEDRDIEVPMGFLLIESARMKDEMSKPAAPDDEKNTSEAAADSQAEKDAAEFIEEEDLEFSANAAELDTSTLDPEATRQPVKETAPLDLLTNAILNAKGVSRMIIISGSGSVLRHNNIPVKEFGSFVAAATGVAVKIKKILGFTGPRHIVVNHSNGEKILIIIGAQIVVGIGLDVDTDPEPISNILKPSVAGIRLQ